jgi:hypothetical protein
VRREEELTKKKAALEGERKQQEQAIRKAEEEFETVSEVRRCVRSRHVHRTSLLRVRANCMCLCLCLCLCVRMPLCRW